MFGIGKKIKKEIYPQILLFCKNKIPFLYSKLNHLSNLKIFYKIKNKKKILLNFKNNLDYINKYEYKINSQNNEDGLIDYIFSKIENSKKFLEVGFHYNECNSLNLIRNGWNGTLIDSDNKICDKMRLYINQCYPNQKINIVNEFIKKFSLKQIIENNNFDFFSLDIDGNDYWIVKELNLSKIKLICCEYNPFFGKDASVKIEYNEDHSYKPNFYFGASLKAFTNLLKEKKFELIAIDSSGTNAFFINKDHLGDFEILDPIKSFKNSGACTYKEFLEINEVLLKRDGLVFLD